MIHCAVLKCNSCIDNSETNMQRNAVKFFPFPKDNYFARIWLMKCGGNINSNMQNLFICSKHFKNEHYQPDFQDPLSLSSTINECNTLKLDAIPTEHLPSFIEMVESKLWKRDFRHISPGSLIENELQSDPKCAKLSTMAPLAKSTLPSPQNIQNDNARVATPNQSSRLMANMMQSQQLSSSLLPNKGTYLVSQPKPAVNVVPTSMLLQQPQAQPLQLIQPVIQPQQIQMNPNQYNPILYSQLVSQPNNTQPNFMINTPSGIQTFVGQTNQSNRNVPQFSMANTNHNFTSTNTINSNQCRQNSVGNNANGTVINSKDIVELLKNMIELQKESNIINRERLEIERNRSANEISMNEKFTNMMSNLIEIISILRQQQIPYIESEETIIEQNDIKNVELLVPKVEKDFPE